MNQKTRAELAIPAPQHFHSGVSPGTAQRLSQGARAFCRARAFLYRRVARWVTCEIMLLGRHALSLDNKFQVNSLQDVLCHPFYWQLYQWLPKEPRLVVDLGAHCGHFSMLADVCFRLQFPQAAPQYLLIEPNPKLVPVIRRNLRRSGLCPRHLIHRGLVGGARTGSAPLWVSPRNYLSASLAPTPQTRAVSCDYIDLESLTEDRPIDLLKIDIEGSEFDFVANYPQLLARVQAIMIEVHEAPQLKQERLYWALAAVGLKPKGDVIQHSGATLARFQRW
jgi:FkbM family methyltransferase